MSDPTFYFEESEGEEPVLVVRGHIRDGRQGSKVWIARITGSDPKHRWRREFLGAKRLRVMEEDGKRPEVGVRIGELKDGDLLEVCSGGSWQWQRRGFYRYRVPIDNPWEQKPPLLERITEEQVAETLGLPTQQVLRRPARRFRI